MTTRFNRRQLLRAGGSLAVGLPLLSSLHPKSGAAETAGPKRLLFMIATNGVVADDFFPSATGTSFSLPYCLEPLEAFRDRLSVVGGLSNESARQQAGNPHTKSGSHTLTCVNHIEGQFTKSGGGGFATDISIDQLVAESIGASSPIRSLLTGYDIGNGANGETPRWRFSSLGDNQPVQPDGDPQQVFNKISGFVANDDDAAEALARLQGERRSILDLAMGEITALQSSLAAVDRQRLDRHLTHLRELEQSIANAPSPLSCNELSAPASASDVVSGTASMSNLIAYAFGCDLSRVASFQWAGAQSQLRYDFLNGVGLDGHHNLSHRDGDEYAVPTREISRWHSEQVAQLASALDAIPEEDGTALDNTILVYLNTLSTGNTHSFENLPVVVLGGGNAGLRTGQAIDVGGRALNDLYITLASALGLGITSFGNPDYVQGPIDALLA